ncbi:23S rRNA (guanine(2445)-N(2))/(guanine(2069)-N(7))-methyltransferase, partial [Buchnera aphidicola]|nr:23S rRNA (guanine(2445)-N(2))/(guanine(2069)-N(7))-methyltransferase [Buchnera aphidicola]
NVVDDIFSIKENVSVSILLNSGWKKNNVLIDPMCQSGTLLIEAAMISADHAPGLKRKKWGFYFWKKYNKNLWEDTIQQALERFKIG